jgi:lysozyme
VDQAKLRSELSRDEGRKLTSYQDTNGYWTIGVGHLLGTTRRMLTITEAECDALLDADIAVAMASCIVVFGTTKFMPLDDVRQRALINMMFNRGEKHVQESTTITPAIRVALNQPKNWDLVAIAIKVSPWAKQIGVRADRLAAMLENGVA